jgi:hypothetical protein
MPSLVFNYGEWWRWETADAGGYPGQKVTFDGPNKLILVNEGEISIDVQTDVYSGWKEWSLQRENTKYLRAISTLGGDPITAETFVGDTYFLENGWRIQPWNSYNGYILDVIGNIYTREPGQNPVNPTSNVSVLLTRSNITETSIVGGTTTTNRLEEIWKILGLDSTNPQIISDTSITVGGITLSITQNTVQETTTVARS